MVGGALKKVVPIFGNVRVTTFATFVMGIAVFGALGLDGVGRPEAMHGADVVVVLFLGAGVAKSRNKVPADVITGRRMPMLFLNDVIS